MVEKKPGKTYQKADAIVFLEACEKLNLTQAQLARELGYESTAPHSWIKTGQIPKVAAIAIEGLLRRRGDSGAAVGEHYILLHIQDQRIVGSRLLTRANKMHLNGQNYLMFPEV